MKIKVGINGMGRIGRMIVRSIIESKFSNIEIKHINNRTNSETCSNLLKYDSIHGKFKANINFDKNHLIINKKKITFGQETDLKKIHWTHFGVVTSNKKLNLLYRAADVLVCPSLYCFGPHIVTEALLNDLPVVGYNLGVAQDTVVNNVNGYLVPKYNNKIKLLPLVRIV